MDEIHRQHPFSIAFSSLREEQELYRTVATLSKRADPLWGIDQELIFAPGLLLEPLAQRASGETKLARQGRAEYHRPMANADRSAALELLAQLGRSPLGRRLILADSSGLFAASENIPALTEDLDLLVDADWLAEAEREVVAELARHGLRHQPETCTFVAADGSALDLVGYSARDRVDRIGGGEKVRVMVFADLSQLLASPEAVVDVPGGGRALSAASLAASKLLTVRVEKGGKDKLQALLLIAENADNPDFLASLRRFLAGFEGDRIQDALADAQAASLGLETDPERTDPQARGYARASEAAAQGLAILSGLVGSREASS